MKTCTKCHTNQSLDQFYRCKNAKDGRGAWCKQCGRNRHKDYVSNPEVRKRNNANRQKRRSKPEVKMKENDARLRHAYGLTTSEYQTMYDTQMGRCAICSGLPNGRFRKLNIDHDHRTGKVRALLCFSCNSAIGYLKEDPNLMERAILYIEHHQGSK